MSQKANNIVILKINRSNFLREIFVSEVIKKKIKTKKNRAKYDQKVVLITALSFAGSTTNNFKKSCTVLMPCEASFL